MLKTSKLNFKDVSNIVLKKVLNNIVWFIILLFAIILSLINENFLSIANFRNLLIQCVIIGILVLGESFCLLVGYFDLAVESSMLFSIIFSTWLMVGKERIKIWLRPVSYLMYHHRFNDGNIHRIFTVLVYYKVKNESIY